MREADDWARWSRELARKIAKGGEQYLIDKAKLVAWQDDDGESSKTFRLLRYGDENIDPLSFFYTLASEGDISKTKNPERISRMYRSVAEAFGIAQEPAFDHRFIFPTPPRVNSLFHERGEGNPRLIWKLFREAVQGIERGLLLEQGGLEHEVRLDVDVHAVASNLMRPSLTAV